MVKTFFSQSDENPLNDALEEAESKCKELRKSKENLEKEKAIIGLFSEVGRPSFIDAHRRPRFKRT